MSGASGLLATDFVSGVAVGLVGGLTSGLLGVSPGGGAGRLLGPPARRGAARRARRLARRAGPAHQPCRHPAILGEGPSRSARLAAPHRRGRAQKSRARRRASFCNGLTSSIWRCWAPSPRADDHDRLRLPPASSVGRSKREEKEARRQRGKKESPPARRSQRCRQYEKPSSPPWPALRLSMPTLPPANPHTAPLKVPK